jgi:hypothetical protein
MWIFYTLIASLVARLFYEALPTDCLLLIIIGILTQNYSDSKKEKGVQDEKV